MDFPRYALLSGTDRLLCANENNHAKYVFPLCMTELIFHSEHS